MDLENISSPADVKQLPAAALDGLAGTGAVYVVPASATWTGAVDDDPENLANWTGLASADALQTGLLTVGQGMIVLEVGTGSGYQACVLAAMGAKVFSIERQRNLFFRTKEILEQLPYRVKTFLGDGYEGLPNYGPFDRIIITAGAPSVPPKLISQMKSGGIMVIPMDDGKGGQTMVRITKQPDGSLSREEFGSFKFVPMLTGTASD